MKPTIGQKVQASHRASKQRRFILPIAREWISDCVRVEWRRIPVSVTGYYIGWRTVFDGVISTNGEDEPSSFRQSGTHEVWLIVPNERSNPVYVFPDDVSLEGEGIAP